MYLSVGGAPEAVCSTPDGVIENQTACSWAGSLAPWWCSTPDGVIENQTQSSSAGDGRSTGAQRLTASSKTKLSTKVPGGTEKVCSTPDGVIENQTGGLRCRSCSRGGVLNA